MSPPSPPNPLPTLIRRSLAFHSQVYFCLRLRYCRLLELVDVFLQVLEDGVLGIDEVPEMHIQAEEQSRLEGGSDDLEEREEPCDGREGSERVVHKVK